MSWEEIKKLYPDEWVCLVDYQITGGVSINGTVIAHATEKQAFREQIHALSDRFKNIAVRFTGDVLVKNPEIPLLWQISPIR